MTKHLWTFPWLYRESVIFVAGVIFIGCILQLVLGEFDFFLLHQPVNYYFAGLILLGGSLLGTSRKSALALWFSGGPLAVALLLGMLFLALLMGLIPQIRFPGFQHSLPGRLVLLSVTTSWPFILLYFLLLLSLCAVTLRRIRKPGRYTVAFFLNHGGLWIALLAAGLGTADMQRHIMHVTEGDVEWRVYADNGAVLELPLAIRLHDFDIEEYPPKLALIDREKGIPLPEGKAEWLQLDTRNDSGRLGEWDIAVHEYIHQAVWAGDGKYREMSMPGASPAVHVTAVSRETGASHEGWISIGNMLQFISALSLDNNLAIVMAQPEPKRFISDISVASQYGQKKRTTLEVNSPLRMGSWMVYQYGYDDKAGKLSTYSSFELVYDPWLPFVYLGLILMSAGAMSLVWFGTRERGGAV